jgi:hypothetical protein
MASRRRIIRNWCRSNESHRDDLGFCRYRGPSHRFFRSAFSRFERAARRKELLFLKSVQLAKANREFVATVAKDMGAGARIHDYVVYAEMYNWLLTELHDSGRLPTDWRKDIKTKFPDI